MARSRARTRAGGDRAVDEAVPDNGGFPATQRLPRSQIGTTPQHLLMTLLGDYWFEPQRAPPFCSPGRSARRIRHQRAERESGAEPAREARVARLLEARKEHVLRSESPRRFRCSGRHSGGIVAFGTREARPWDGAWTIVAFSVPEAHRDVRHSIRTTLRWLGFAALYDGLWCSPWLEQDAALAMLSDLGVHSATVMRARIDPRSAVQALSAWDLEALGREYLEFEAEFSPIAGRRPPWGADRVRGAGRADQGDG